MAGNDEEKRRDQEAIDALDQALQINFEEDGNAVRKVANSDGTDQTMSTDASNVTSSGKADLAKELGPEPAPRAPGDTQPKRTSFSAANDPDRRLQPAILRTLEARSSRATMRNATTLALLWTIGGLAIGYITLFPEILDVSSIKELVGMAGFLPLLTAIIAPVILFIGFGVMISRAQEMRNAAQSMAEVALRLAEPETAASDRIISIGQAVRREVSAMNEGIERTIARATELETLVHSEVNALERSYSDNELRVRSLVNELGNEREAIVTHAERLRSSISGAHESLKDELDNANELITAQMAMQGEAFASMIDTRTALLMEKTDSVTHTIGSMLTSKSDDLLSSLNSSGLALSNEFDTRLQELTATLSANGANLLQEFETHASSLDSSTDKLNAVLNERTNQLNELLAERAREFSESLTVGQEAISNGLDDIISSLNSALDEKGATFRQSLKSAVDESVIDLDLRSSFFEDRLQGTVSQINSAFDDNVAAFAEAFDQRSGSLDSKLRESFDRINSTISSGKDEFDGILGSSIEKLGTTLSDHSFALAVI